MKSMSISKFSKFAAILCAGALALSACASGGSAGGAYPSGPINLTAPSQPGSGWDTTARAMAKSIEEKKLLEVPLPVQNKPGGTGCTWLTQMVSQYKGKDDQLAVTSLASQTMNEQGLCDYGPTDATLIATLFVENFIVVSATNNDIKDLDGLISALKQDPQKTTIAASGDDRLPFALLADAAGIDPTKLTFLDYDGGGEQTTALLNGDAKVAIAGLSEFRGNIDAGELKPIVSFAPERLEAPFENVPVAVESGYDVTLANWRGVYGPADMPDEAKKYWEDVFAKMVETDSWKTAVQRNQWTEMFMTGSEMNDYVENAAETVRKGVEKTGIGLDK